MKTLKLSSEKGKGQKKKQKTVEFNFRSPNGENKYQKEDYCTVSPVYG